MTRARKISRQHGAPQRLLPIAPRSFASAWPGRVAFVRQRRRRAGRRWAMRVDAWHDSPPRRAKSREPRRIIILLDDGFDLRIIRRASRARPSRRGEHPA